MEKFVPEKRGINLSSPDAPLKLYRLLATNARQGKNMDVGGFLQGLADLDSTGAIDKLPALKDKILEAGQDPLLWLEVYGRTRDSINNPNPDPQQIQTNLRLAHLLGMDQTSNDPRRQAAVDQINQWKAQFQPEPEVIQPTKERLTGARQIENALRQLIAQHNISEDEAIAMLRKGQTKKPQAKGGGLTRRQFGQLALAAVAGAAFGRLTAPSPQTPEQIEKTEQTTVFDEFIKPLKQEVQRRRAERSTNDPEFYHRVDKELNEDRINFLLFFSGAFHRWGLEPTESRVENRANQIISFNTKTKTVDLISITGDVRGPKAEKYAESKGQIPKQLGINHAFDTGKLLGGSEAEGLKLMRETFEEATGLSIDFEGVGTNGVVKDFIDQVFGRLEVEVLYDFNSYKVEIDGKEHPDYLFKEGKQKMDGVGVVQYISADDYDRDWTQGVKDRLHHNRKHIIIESLRRALRENLANPASKAIFGAKFLAFLKPQLDQSRLKLDFEMGNVLNFGVLTDPKSLTRPLGLNFEEGQSIVIVDDVYGGAGGVKMTKKDAETNPKSRKNLDSAPDLWWLQIPPNSDPKAEDLVNAYWGVPGGPREIIRRKLLYG